MIKRSKTEKKTKRELLCYYGNIRDLLKFILNALFYSLLRQY